MSHVTKMLAKFNDLTALRLACERMGLHFHEGHTTFNRHSSYEGVGLGKCLHMISITEKPCRSEEYGYNFKHPYEIGVIQGANGTYELAYDAFKGGNGLVDKIGANQGNLLRSNYEACRLELEAQAQGYTTSYAINEQGYMVITATEGGSY